MDAYFGAFFGVLLGFLIIGRVGSWVLALGVTLKTYRDGQEDARPRRPLIWALPLAVVFHSGPWLLGGALGLSYYVLSHPHASWLWWFLGGLWAAPAFLVLLLGTRLLKPRSVRDRTPMQSDAERELGSAKSGQINEPH